MASQRQFEANRANARRSTGPKSIVGRARSRMNALKHGLTAREIVIGDENPTDLETLRADLEQEFLPQSAMQRALVDRLTGLLWRLGRVAKVESAMAKEHEAKPDPPSDVSAEERQVVSQYEEARRRCREAFILETGDPNSIGAAMMDGRWHERLRHFISEVREEGPQENDASDVPETSTGPGVSGLTLLIQNEHDWLGKLARYETSLMNALARTLGLLYLLQSGGEGRVIEHLSPTVGRKFSGS